MFPEHVFIINLRRQSGRRDHITAQLSQQGIRKFQIVKALDGQEYQINTAKSVEYLKDANNPNGYITPGWIANHMTYSTLFDWCTRLGYEEILVLEDDARLEGSFVYDLILALNGLPKDADVLICGGWDLQPDKAQPAGPHLIKPGFAILAHCVLYRMRAIHKINECLDHFIETFDFQVANGLYYGEQQQLNVYMTKKPIANPDQQFPSDGSPYFEYR